jgi:hypothetical protein
MSERRDFLRGVALTGGLWVFGAKMGLPVTALAQDAPAWPPHPFFLILSDFVVGEESVQTIG